MSGSAASASWRAEPHYSTDVWDNAKPNFLFPASANEGIKLWQSSTTLLGCSIRPEDLQHKVPAGAYSGNPPAHVSLGSGHHLCVHLSSARLGFALSSGIIVRGVPRRGVPVGNRLQTQRRRAWIRIRYVSKSVWIRIKMPCFYSRIYKSPELVPQTHRCPNAFLRYPPVRYPPFD